MRKLRRSALTFGSLITAIVLLVALLGLTVNSVSSNVSIEVITGEGGMPGPNNLSTEGRPLQGEKFVAVFTEPFPNLNNWADAKVIKSVGMTNGQASVHLKPGKYGVYYIYNGEKVLYNDLQLANPRNDIGRNEQGPWFVKVNRLIPTRVTFSINRSPS